MSSTALPGDGVGGAAIDNRICAATPFDVVPRELSSDLGKRRIGFGHTGRYVDCALHGRVWVGRPIRFVAAGQYCRDSARRFYR